jgi:hypothetical protein
MYYDGAGLVEFGWVVDWNAADKHRKGASTMPAANRAGHVGGAY